MVAGDAEYPNQLARVLRNWLREAHESPGSLPAGIDPDEWAALRFVAWWAGPVRVSLGALDEHLAEADARLADGDVVGARRCLDAIRQLVGEDLRGELGLDD